MKRILSFMAALLTGAAAFAQFAPTQLITWSTHVESTEQENVCKVVFTGKIADGYHTYTLKDEFSATEFMDVTTTGCELAGAPYEIGTPKADKLTIKELVKATKLNTEKVNMALGWLSRENKVFFEEVDGTLFVSNSYFESYCG